MNTKEPSTLMSPVTFRRDIHPDLRADYVLANPPFNDSDCFRKDDEVHWQPSGTRSTAKGSPQGEHGNFHRSGFLSMHSQEKLNGFPKNHGSLSWRTRFHRRWIKLVDFIRRRFAFGARIVYPWSFLRKLALELFPEFDGLSLPLKLL